jgi:hypothetical protein
MEDFTNTPWTQTSSLSETAEAAVSRDWVKIALAVAVLALLGLNVFAYLSQITEWFGKTFGPLFRGTVGTAANVVGETASQTIETAAKGTEAAIKGAAAGATTGIGELQKALGGKMNRNNIDGRGIDFGKGDTSFVMDQDDDDADTSVVGHKTKGHSGGFCYIGEDRGVRSCLRVEKGERCMSGDIYPTMDVCVNPSLRA